MKNKTFKELLDEVPSESFLKVRSTGNNHLVFYKESPDDIVESVVAEFDNEDDAENYIGGFNGRRMALESSRFFRRMIR